MYLYMCCSLFYEMEDFYTPVQTLKEAENGGISVARGWSIKRIDATKQIAYLEDNRAIKYNKCLIATGATPKGHPLFDEINEKEILERVIYHFNIKFVIALWL